MPSYILLPPLSKEEFAALEADVKAHGVLQPILVDEDGNILDGHHRHRIDPGAPRKVLTGLSEGEKLATVWRCNFNRRNLSPAQKADARKKMKATAKQLREEDPKKWTQERVAAALGVDQTTVSLWFAKAKLTTTTSARNTCTPAATTTYAPADPAPNATVKVDPKQKPLIAERVEAGESQAQVAADYGITQQQVSNIAKAEAKKAEAAKAPPVEPPSGKYAVLYADPPWRYEHSVSDSRQIENQYPTMELSDICALAVPDICLADSVLFLWATSPKLAEALEVIVAWGFTYKTCMVWVKDKIGMGYYARQRHELLLIGAKGKLPVPEPKDRPDSVIEEPRGKHSQKPARFRQIIEAMYPKAHRIELFARVAAPNWSAWGNEIK